jgi:hypothetical protein
VDVENIIVETGGNSMAKGANNSPRGEFAKASLSTGRTAVLDEFAASSGWQDSIFRQWLKLAQMAAMNLMTPVSAVNEAILSVLARSPSVYPEDYREMLREAAWSYANTAGNPLHFLLTSIAFFMAVLRMRSSEGKMLAQLSLVAITGYVFISFSNCATWTVCMRYQLPVHVFGAVLLGSSVSRVDKRFGMALVSVLLVYSLPYVLLNNMRPVIGMKPWPTRIRSVFTTPRGEILFAHIPNFRDEYEWVADQIDSEQCKEVGLFLEAYDFEYPIWWLLEAPYSGIRLEHLNPTNETARYGDPDFMPCAVICTICVGEGSLENLPLVSDFGHIQYYARPRFSE